MPVPARTLLLANGQRFTLEPGGGLPPRAIAGHFTPVNTLARITAAGGGNNPFFNPGNVFEFHCDAALEARPGMRVRPRRNGVETGEAFLLYGGTEAVIGPRAVVRKLFALRINVSGLEIARPAYAAGLAGGSTNKPQPHAIADDVCGHLWEARSAGEWRGQFRSEHFAGCLIVAATVPIEVHDTFRHRERVFECVGCDKLALDGVHTWILELRR